jgi:hypothetical protein
LHSGQPGQANWTECGWRRHYNIVSSRVSRRGWIFLGLIRSKLTTPVRGQVEKSAPGKSNNPTVSSAQVCLYSGTLHTTATV